MFVHFQSTPDSILYGSIYRPELGRVTCFWPINTVIHSPDIATAELFLKLDKNWECVLCIPHARIIQFSTQPLEWLHFLAFTIYGQAGDIFTTPDGPKVSANCMNSRFRKFFSSRYCYNANGR